MWQQIALVCIGIIATGVGMLIRGDYLGTRAARDVEDRLSQDIRESEDRINARIDREVAAISTRLADMNALLLRIDQKVSRSQ